MLFLTRKAIDSFRFKEIDRPLLSAQVKSKTTRHDYIPYALEDCASDKELFLSASEPEDIETGLSDLFEQYLTNVRLTQ